MIRTGSRMRPRVMNRTTAIMIYVLSLIYFPNLSPVEAETDKRTEQEEGLVIGTGTVVDGKVAEARKTALSEALVKGVEEYLAKRMGKQGDDESFFKVDPRCLTPCQGRH